MAGNWGWIRMAPLGCLATVLAFATSCGGDDEGPATDAGTGVKPSPTVEECFADIAGGLSIDYTRLNPKVGSHCMGTNNQDITDIERVVFLGDSVTTGTPPTKVEEFFRTLLEERLKVRFPGVEIKNCSAFGARTDDFLLGKKQVQQCFSDLFDGDEAKAGATDDRRTLVIFTIGGNDVFAWADDALDDASGKQAALDAAQLLEDAVAFIKDEKRFTAGGFVIYGNPYEFTDGTGDVESCPLAGTIGLSGNQIDLAPAVLLFTERFMEIAVTHNADVIFMLESFCGHGYHHDDKTTQCYRGPDAGNWFDGTCIHPNPTGHAVIADMFEAVIAE